MKFFFALLLLGLVATPAWTDDIPRFQVNAAWPKPLPNQWIMGQAAGVAVDAQDHIWVIQRPRTLTDDEKALTLAPPPSKCCRPAPPVMEFDAEGNLITAWGGWAARREIRLAAERARHQHRSDAASSGSEAMEKSTGNI